MPRAKLRVSLPESAWIGALSRAQPSVTFRVLAALPMAETGVGLVELIGPDLGAVIEEMNARDAVLTVDVLAESDDRMVIEFETSEPLLLFSVQESGVPLEPPIEIVDGEATVEVTATQDRLSDFGTQLEQFGMRFDVEYIRRGVKSTEQLLTDSQRDLVLTAVERGYYDTPRECSLTDIADHLDMAKSTVSETLHRAESAIISEFVAELEEDI
ncbi:helix-turn-helix domain-containing protein [Halorientalis marina]|mgnify:CR=1 FL=1|jgi:hypothetical protein|uniref:helix-turn-helix domain-containing protein n=1 Tax=Halorientalis marina TaxID=2931976 RepID=UPI001FF3EAA8|nr:helix-turn-helix domain-containing protein [Halorientalis marina]